MGRRWGPNMAQHNSKACVGESPPWVQIPPPPPVTSPARTTTSRRARRRCGGCLGSRRGPRRHRGSPAAHRAARASYSGAARRPGRPLAALRRLPQARAAPAHRDLQVPWRLQPDPGRQRARRARPPDRDRGRVGWERRARPRLRRGRGGCPGHGVRPRDLIAAQAAPSPRVRRAGRGARAGVRRRLRRSHGARRPHRRRLLPCLRPARDLRRRRDARARAPRAARHGRAWGRHRPRGRRRGWS